MIGNEGAKVLLKSCWPILRKINVNSNRIGLDGILNLKINWPMLKKFTIGDDDYNDQISVHCL